MQARNTEAATSPNQKEPAMDIYTTRNEAVQREIIEPLGEYAQEHNIDAIAEQLIVHYDHITPEGNVDVTRSGYVVDQALDFWAVVSNNAL